MLPPVFTDFNKYIFMVGNKNYQPSNKSNKKIKYTLPLTLVGTASGAMVPALKTNKNVKMQYAVFAKEQLKPYRTKEFDKTHIFQAVPRFSRNPITHIKELKAVLKYVEEDIADLFLQKKDTSRWTSALEKFLLDSQMTQVRMQQAILEYDLILADIKYNFKNMFYQKLSKKVISGILIGSTIGTVIGIVIDKAIKKREN